MGPVKWVRRSYPARLLPASTALSQLPMVISDIVDLDWRSARRENSHVNSSSSALICVGLPDHPSPQQTMCIGTLQARDVSLFVQMVQGDGEQKLKHLWQVINLVLDRHWSQNDHAAARVSRLACAALWRSIGT